MTRRGAARGLLGVLGALALGGVASGCGPSAADTAEALTRVAEQVDGVRSAELEVASGAEFEKALEGVVEIDRSDRTAVLAVFDAVLGAIARHVKDSGRDEHLDVQGLTGRGSSGESVSVFDLDGSLVHDAVPIRALYPRYGLA